MKFFSYKSEFFTYTFFSFLIIRPTRYISSSKIYCVFCSSNQLVLAFNSNTRRVYLRLSISKCQRKKSCTKLSRCLVNVYERPLQNFVECNKIAIFIIKRICPKNSSSIGFRVSQIYYQIFHSIDFVKRTKHRVSIPSL